MAYITLVIKTKTKTRAAWIFIKTKNTKHAAIGILKYLLTGLEEID